MSLIYPVISVTIDFSRGLSDHKAMKPFFLRDISASDTTFLFRKLTSLRRFGSSARKSTCVQRFQLAIVICTLFASFFEKNLSAQEAHPNLQNEIYQKNIQPFLKKHCIRCHGETKSEAGLKLDVLPRDFLAGSRDARAWREVLDRLNLGEMPPEDEPQPEQTEHEATTRWILKELKRAVATSKDGAGQIVLRRLNREEYNNTIQDLLGFNARPADLFPADGTAHGFDNIGRALMMSPLLMEKYMFAARKLLDRAIVTGEQPKVVKRRVEVENLSRYFTRQKTRRTFHSGFMVRQSDFLLMTRGTTFLPTVDSFRFSPDEEYAFRVRASAIEGGSYPPRMVIMFDGIKIWEGDVEASELAPKVYEVRVPVESSSTGGRRVVKVAYPNFDVNHTMPLALDYIEIEGPIYDQWPPESHRRIFFKGPEAEKNFAYAREIVSRFATRAYRRPLHEEEVDNLMILYRAERDQGSSFEESIKVALTVVLCAHDFLFLVEPKSTTNSKLRPLSDFELASRLSYFLWNSMPDKELFGHAQTGRLSDESVLESQVRRMLKDPKSARFVKSFVGQWLQTRLVGSFPPDKMLFPNYDYHLETSMIRETESFFAEIMRNDLSALNFIDSDFSMLNERLARHYGIAGVKGDHFRKVRLPADSQRGGIVTHASILTGLSDGTRTKPIKRGVWILENLLGDPPPPPPPNAGEIEPNKKGNEALSLRQRMEQHRQNPACASCHRKIDPLGFSLQNYDAVGAWRTHETGVEQVIDASGELPDGTRFSSPVEFKNILMKQKDSFCRCLTEKLFVYALSRGLEITDRDLVERISRDMSKNDYRITNLIIGIVNSDAFQSK